jgi:putative transposase
MRELNAIFSRQLNSLRGIRGSNIEKDYNLVIVDMATGERAFEHAVYILANAVRANLVERTSEWLAPNSYSLEYGEVVTAQQPKRGLWSDKVAHAERKASRRSKRARYAVKSKLPQVAHFKLVRPPIRPELSDAELRAAIRAEVTKVEDALIAERRRTGRQVMGWKRVVAKHYLEIPNGTEEYFGVRPTFSGDDEASRHKARNRRRRFLADYYAARDRFFAGVRDVVFPFGTWLMKRVFKVNCATCRPAMAA